MIRFYMCIFLGWMGLCGALNAEPYIYWEKDTDEFLYLFSLYEQAEKAQKIFFEVNFYFEDKVRFKAIIRGHSVGDITPVEGVPACYRTKLYESFEYTTIAHIFCREDKKLILTSVDSNPPDAMPKHILFNKPFLQQR